MSPPRPITHPDLVAADVPLERAHMPLGWVIAALVAVAGLGGTITVAISLGQATASEQKAQAITLQAHALRLQRVEDAQAYLREGLEKDMGEIKASIRHLGRKPEPPP